MNSEINRDAMQLTPKINDVLTTLHMCGCGPCDDVLLYIYKTLVEIKTRSESDWKVDLLKDRLESGDMALQIALYYLDSANLLQHGGSIGGSWLTEKGYVFLEKLEAVLPELTE